MRASVQELKQIRSCSRSMMQQNGQKKSRCCNDPVQSRPRIDAAVEPEGILLKNGSKLLYKDIQADKVMQKTKNAEKGDSSSY